MATQNSTPQERIRIFNRQGIELCDVRAFVERSWIMGDEGRASFTLASSDLAANEDFIQFGNWLLVENDYLPSWVGIIDTPREWGIRTVTVNAFTPERQLALRRGPLEEKVTGSAGTIFERIINLVNAAEPTPIAVGDIYRGGSQREETLNPTTFNQDLRRIYSRSAEEYSWRPVVTSKRLVVYADWQIRLGSNVDIALEEGQGGGNIEATDAPMIEDEPIINDVLGYGDGTAWTSKPNAVAQDSDSIAKYGLRQASKEWSGTNLATIATNNNNYLATVKNPVRLFDIQALNVGEVFINLRLGNKMPLKMQSVGFGGVNTNVRILGMYYNPADGQKVELVLQEVP